jgi:LEA14-like dessication related protein
MVGGCASLGGLEKPDVMLVDLQVDDVKAFEGSARATMRLDNENLEPLQIEGGVYEVYINGTRIGKGLSNKHFEIPGLSSVTQEVQVNLSTLAMARGMISVINAEQLQYRIDSIVYIRLDGRVRRVTMSRAGQLDRTDLPGNATR